MSCCYQFQKSTLRSAFSIARNSETNKEPRPCEVNSRYILLNTKFHYCFHKISPVVRILSQINPVQYFILANVTGILSHILATGERLALATGPSSVGHLNTEAKPSLRNVVFPIGDWTTDDVQNCDSYIEV
jgi:hypothetical protein